MAAEPLVSLVTCRSLPEPDPDEPLLLAAFHQAGVPARLVAWDDPEVDWAATPLTVIRSTWNYYRFHDDFIDWTERVARHSELHNPASLVLWNSHKAYLLDLHERGLPVVPTVLLESGVIVPPVAELMAERGWTRAVLKPAVSAGSFQTHVISHDTVDQTFVDRLLDERDLLLQPWVASVTDYGERSLVFIDGELTHSIRKSPRFAGEHESVSGALPVEPPEHALATRVLDSLGQPLLYARVDLARDDDGQPMLMELEVIEPSLFFRQHPPALTAFVEAVRRRLPTRSA